MLNHIRPYSITVILALGPIDWPFLLDFGQLIDGPRLTTVDLQRSIDCVQSITVNLTIDHGRLVLSCYNGQLLYPDAKFQPKFYNVSNKFNFNYSKDVSKV